MPKFPLLVNLAASVEPLLSTRNLIKSIVPVADVLCNVKPSVIAVPPIIFCPPLTPSVPTNPVNPDEAKSKSDRFERCVSATLLNSDILNALSTCEANVADFWKIIRPTSLPEPINLFGIIVGLSSTVADANVEYWFVP